MLEAVAECLTKQTQDRRKQHILFDLSQGEKDFLSFASLPFKTLALYSLSLCRVVYSALFSSAVVALHNS